MSDPAAVVATTVPSSTHSRLSRSAFWKGQLRTWHWISSALCLAGLLLFAFTGFTLNHADSIGAEPKTENRDITLSPALLTALEKAENGKPLAPDLAAALEKETKVSVTGREAEVADGEVTIDLAAPGVDSYVTVDTAGGTATYERIDRGVIAKLNDLHKGRDAGPVWALFIDVIAVACVIFSLTGLGLLWVHARGRSLTWPLTTLGLIVPVILFILFVHS